MSAYAIEQTHNRTQLAMSHTGEREKDGVHEVVVTMGSIDGERLARVLMRLERWLITQDEEISAMVQAAELDADAMVAGGRRLAPNPRLVGHIAELMFAYVFSEVWRHVVRVKVEFSAELEQGAVRVQSASSRTADMVADSAAEVFAEWHADLNTYAFLLKTLAEWQQPGEEAWVIQDTHVFEWDVEEARSFELRDVEPLECEHGNLVGFVCPLCERDVPFSEAVWLEDGYRACPHCTSPMAVVSCGLDD